MGRRRQQVSLRVRVRRRRTKLFAWSVLLAASAALGSAAVRRWDLGARLKGAAAPLITVEDFDAKGVPEPARAGVARRAEALRGRPVSPWALRKFGKELSAAFPYLRELRVRRSWRSRTAGVSAVLRKPVARVLGGKGERWMDGEGAVFSAPEGLFAEALPSLRWQGEPDDAARMAAFLREVEGDLPVRRAERSPDGWTLQLEDGLVLKWGGLERTREKLGRLTQAMEDARGRFPELESADLRFFEDGRILVRPVGAK